MGIFFKDKEKTYPESVTGDTLYAFRASDGNDSAFEYLVKKHERLVFTAVYGIVGNPDDAMDVSQEVFLKVYKSLSSFKGDSEFSTWLYRIAKNCALDFVRQKKTSPISIDTSGEESEGFDIPDESTKSNPEKSVLSKERRQMLHKALGLLSDEHREIIILRDMNDYSYEEIAERLEIEPGTVKSRLFRAREALRKILLKENYF